MQDPSDDISRRELFSSAWAADDFAPPSTSVRADFGVRSHRGRVLAENEDHFLVLRLGRHQEALFTSLSMRDVAQRYEELAYVAVVADGIGGGGVGAVAARLAVATLADLGVRFGKWNTRIDPQTTADIIDRAEWYFRRTHESVLHRRLAHVELSGMATTLTGFYSVGTDLFVTHVGHSRCYLFRNGALTQLTDDQTLRERFATAPHPAPVGQAMEDLRHILTDVIGARTEPGVTVERFALLSDDIVLLCTNGLTDMVDDESIAEVLAARRSAAEQCDQLVDLALAGGGEDNVTVVLAQYATPKP